MFRGDNIMKEWNETSLTEMEKLTFKRRDEFERKRIADIIISLLDKNLKNISPMAIDGDWGSGKTEFCHKMINEINSNHKEWKTIYINAFKFDYMDDPFSVIISQIMPKISDEKIKKDIRKSATPIIRTLGKTLGRAGISWVLRQNSDDIAEEFKDAMTEASGSLIDIGIEKYLEDFEQIENNISTFKKCLTDAVKDKKTIIFIDELDRCRPLFALSMIEKIKHIFDIENIGFVFFTKLDQIEAMAKKQYGSEIDAAKYLSKFFSFLMELAEKDLSDSYTYRTNAFVLFREKMTEFRDRSNQGIISYHTAGEDLFSFLFYKDNISLRDAQRLYSKILICKTFGQCLGGHGNPLITVLNLLGIYINIFHRELAHKIINGNLTYQDISVFFDIKTEGFFKFNDRNPKANVYLLSASLIDHLPTTETGQLSIEHKDKISKLSQRWNQSLISRDGKSLPIIREAIEEIMFLRI